MLHPPEIHYTVIRQPYRGANGAKEADATAAGARRARRLSRACCILVTNKRPPALRARAVRFARIFFSSPVVSCGHWGYCHCFKYCHGRKHPSLDRPITHATRPAQPLFSVAANAANELAHREPKKVPHHEISSPSSRQRIWLPRTLSRR